MNIFNFLDRISLKTKIFIPILLGVVVSFTVITLQLLNTGKETLYDSLEQSLLSETQIIAKMFERERDLKLENVKSLFKITIEAFEAAEFKVSEKQYTTEIKNQITGQKHAAVLHHWFLKGKAIEKDFAFVDSIMNRFSLTATIFQKSDSGYVRVSTNVPASNGQRALYTYIPNQSPVIQTIEKGNTFYGRAYVVNDYYITAYRPIVYEGVTVGMLYVGSREKDIKKLSAKLDKINMRKSGKIFVLNNDGNYIYPTNLRDKKWPEKKLFNQMQAQSEGVIEYTDKSDEKKYLLAYTHYPDFEISIVAQIDKRKEVETLTRRMAIDSLIIVFIILSLFALFLVFITNEGINRYLQRIEKSKKQLRSAETALEYSENKFRMLFDNSSDEIFVADLQGDLLEVNKIACESLGYAKDELLNMNFTEIKSDKFRAKVKENINAVVHKKSHTYETEHLTKTGHIIPTEMKSRLISFNGRPAILSISRNITERKKIQKQIIQTIIKTEEKERKRFAADLHDGLSPILSTIRLYSDLLRSKYKSKGQETELIDNIEELADMAISSAKEISNNLTPQVLHDFGLATAIEEFCRFLNKTKSVKITTDTSGYKVQDRIFAESILYQTAKELIHNTVKHAEAQHIFIELKNTEKYIYLYYKDDGIGFDTAKLSGVSGGLGLSNIQNKIKTLKGTCDFNSRPGKGMFVLISVAIDQNENMQI